MSLESHDRAMARIPRQGQAQSTLEAQNQDRTSGVCGAAAQKGSVTAELAVVLPAITVLLAILLLSASAGLLQLRLEEGARAGARALARGDSTAQVQEIVARVSGAQAAVSVGNSGGYATVTVQGRVGGVLSGLVPWTQTATASARVEVRNYGASVQREPENLALRHGKPIHKSALWRWVADPGYQLGAGHCGTVAVVQGGDFNGQG